MSADDQNELEEVEYRPWEQPGAVRRDCEPHREEFLPDPLSMSMTSPPVALLGRQPPTVSVSLRAVTYLGLPSTTARPLR